MADLCRSADRHLDELSIHAKQLLSLAFKSTYEATVTMDKHA